MYIEVSATFLKYHCIISLVESKYRVLVYVLCLTLILKCQAAYAINSLLHSGQCIVKYQCIITDLCILRWVYPYQNPDKHEELSQRWLNVGPPSPTLVQH